VNRRGKNPDMATSTALRASFRRYFDEEPALYRAPGRVNLIGEHTDYNCGYVMPVAIGFYTYVAVRPRIDGKVRVHSTNFQETVELPPADAPAGVASPGQRWSDYVWGVVQSLKTHGIDLPGADLLIHGEVPLGAGLSSSASLEVATTLALASMVGCELDPLTLAQLGQQAENDFVGIRCGIMDQFAAAFGRQGYALCLDCRSLAYRPVPLDVRATIGARGAPRLVVCNTMVKHQLAASEYNLRRAQCERGVAELARTLPHVRTLRDATPADLERAREGLDKLIYRRCRHVVTENERVVAASVALEACDYQGVGELMAESHRSLREDYEVSCEELDLLVRLAQDIDGVYGARMTGGGFGGCTVNLLREDAVEKFSALIAARYQQASGARPEIYVCQSADGASQLAPEQFNRWQPWQRVSPA
jgi:galactokinase